MTYLDSKIYLKSGVIAELREIEERLIQAQIEELTRNLEEIYKQEELRLEQELQLLLGDEASSSNSQVDLKRQENTAFLTALQEEHLQQVKDLQIKLNAELTKKLRWFASLSLNLLLGLYNISANRGTFEIRVRTMFEEANQVEHI